MFDFSYKKAWQGQETVRGFIFRQNENKDVVATNIKSMKEKLKTLIENCAAEPYQKPMLQQIQPSIRLKTLGVPSETTGKTKLGGVPDFPPNVGWPKSAYNGQSLSFLGQVRLSELKPFDELNLLPGSGMLYFFFNLDSVDDGKVIFTPEENRLESAAPPDEFLAQKQSFWKQLLGGKSKKRVLKESDVAFYKTYDIPSWDSLKVEKIYKETKTSIKPLDAFKDSILDGVYEEGETETTSNHHLLGHYKGIQNEFHELNFLDIDMDEEQDLSLEQINKALQWKLLLQFDSDKNLEINWGDWGGIYFFIHENDLEQQYFDRVRIWADCY